MTRFRRPSDDPIRVRRGPQRDPGPELRGCALLAIFTGIVGSVCLALVLLAGIIAGFVWAVAEIGATP